MHACSFSDGGGLLFAYWRFGRLKGELFAGWYEWMLGPAYWLAFMAGWSNGGIPRILVKGLYLSRADLRGRGELSSKKVRFCVAL